MLGAATKHALIVGNAAYSENIKLSSPLRDATAMASALKELGFVVTCKTDMKFDEMNGAVSEFVGHLQTRNADICLFYYSGHGLQIGGQNFAVPIDFDQASASEEIRLVRLQTVVDRIAEVSAARLIFLDACRNGDGRKDMERFSANIEGALLTKAIEIDPLSKAIIVAGTVQPKFVEMKAERNTFIAFATASGDVASDGNADDLGLSPFTEALTKHIESVDLPLSNLMSRVRLEVLELTNQRQKTWDQSSLTAPYYFNPGSLLLFMGNTMAFFGFLLSLIPYSLVLREQAPWSMVLLAALLPTASLSILLFGLQNVYARLRGNFMAQGDDRATMFDHFTLSLQKGSLGGFLGSFFGAFVIGIPYHRNWTNIDLRSPGTYDEVAPLGSVLLEISVATALTACLLGSLSLYFTKANLSQSGFKLTQKTSSRRILFGATIGGTIAGMIAAPLLTVYFGRFSRPEMTPEYLLPGAIFGSAFLIFSIVNFDFERLNVRRIIWSGAASLASLGVGVCASVVVFGILYATGLASAVIRWMEDNSEDLQVLFGGGLIYGIPVGAILGLVVGSAVLLTERWSGKPVLWSRSL